MIFDFNVDFFINILKNNLVIGIFFISFLIILQVIIAVIPSGPFQFIAGAVYGPFFGTIICLISFTIGSIIVFLLTKTYGFKLINIFFKKEDIYKFECLINNTKTKFLFFIIFLIPGSPKDILSYIVGLTNINLFQFLIINILGRIPSTLLTVYSGDKFVEKNYYLSFFFIVVLIFISIIGYFVYNNYFTKHKQ